jgi:hypothetical protein
MRLVATVGSGVVALSALLALSSDAWLAAGYGRDRSTVVAGADEAAWLASRAPIGLKPVAVAAPVPQSDSPAHSRLFAVGARLAISGPEALRLEIISAQPTSAESGLVDGQGRPLVVVTARERNGVRLIRLLVEADRLTTGSEKSL